MDFCADGSSLYRAEPAVVCDRCIAEESAEEPVVTFDDQLNEEMTLDDMANVIESYKPDATVSPELYEDINVAPQAISPQIVFLVQDMMRDVVRRGTGRRAMVLERNDLSGKTGTSNDRRDAWFGGFNADLATIVWVGYDDDLPLGPGEEGSRTALPVWIEFMRIALAGMPENQMPMPEGIVSVLIDRDTGCPARAGQGNTTFEVFREGHVPECEQLDDLSDPFNSPADLDPEPEQDEEVESIF